MLVRCMLMDSMYGNIGTSFRTHVKSLITYLYIYGMYSM